jgi:aspartyl-tRNA synthetase
MWQDIEAMYAGRIDQVRGQHYDLVLNGVEIGGGSVRVHDAVMQEYIFSQVLQLSDAEKSSFDHLLHALKCGAPPHGGIALGFDRLMAILCKAPTIRDVIAFPKTGAGTDLLFRSPAAINEEMLYQYGVQPTRC